MTALEQLGSYVANGHRSAMAAPVLHAVNLHVLDTVGAWIAATGTAEGRALTGFRMELRGEGGRGQSLAQSAADVMTSCALARLSEIDDIHLASMTTPGSIIIPGALTIAASLPKSKASALAEAIVVGYEAIIRLGLSLDGPTILYRGIWPTYFAAPFGIAAVAARLLDLNEQQAAHALAFALTVAAPGVGRHSAPTTSRWLAVGHAARSGLSAALAARSGFTSDLDLLDGPFLPGIYNVKTDVNMVTRGLGEQISLLDVSFKSWCAARQTMAATQALKEIVDSGVMPDDISEIEAYVLPPHLKMIDHGVVAGDRASYLTSLSYQMALGILAPDAAGDVRQSPGEISAVVRALMDKIEVKPDESLLSRYPKTWPARAHVLTRSGTSYERMIEHVPGDPDRPFDETRLREKFYGFSVPLVGEERAAKLAQLGLAVLDDDHAPLSLVQEMEQVCGSVSVR